MEMQLTSKKLNGLQQFIAGLQDNYGITKEEALTLTANTMFHYDVQKELYDWAHYELTGILPEDQEETDQESFKPAALSPAQRILFEEAEKRIKFLEQKEKAYLSELRDYERTVSKLRAEVKSLKMELKQKEEK